MDKILFRETQRPRHFWMIIMAVFLTSAIFWWGFIQQIIMGIQFGDKPMTDGMLVFAWFLIGIVFPLGVCSLKLVTEVRNDGLFIRLVPFHIRYQRFPIQDILRVKSITYSSISRFGGWGIRINVQGERAYNIGGKQGIELKLASGSIIVIGTQRPNELKKILASINISPY